jgi:hypothetical protein
LKHIGRIEIFGIFLSIPAAFVISMIYCVFVAKLVMRSDQLISWVRVASQIVLVLLVAEVIVVTSIGAVRSRAVLGPSFYVVHLVLFFICTPALAHLLVFRYRKRWYLVPFACTALAFFLAKHGRPPGSAGVAVEV